MERKEEGMPTNTPDPEIVRAIVQHQHMSERMRSAFQILCRAAEIEVRQAQALIQLYQSQAAPTLMYLATRLQIRHHTVVDLINHMVENGWVERDKEQRPILLRLTEQGKHKAEVIFHAYVQVYDNLGPLVTEAFNQVIDTIRIRDEDGNDEDDEN